MKNNLDKTDENTHSWVFSPLDIQLFTAVTESRMTRWQWCLIQAGVLFYFLFFSCQAACSFRCSFQNLLCLHSGSHAGCLCVLMQMILYLDLYAHLQGLNILCSFNINISFYEYLFLSTFFSF